ncbi:response regulator [bacterium]|nr:response regulator [bacterium]
MDKEFQKYESFTEQFSGFTISYSLSKDDQIVLDAPSNSFRKNSGIELQKGGTEILDTYLPAQDKDSLVLKTKSLTNTHPVTIFFSLSQNGINPRPFIGFIRKSNREGSEANFQLTAFPNSDQSYINKNKSDNHDDLGKYYSSEMISEITLEGLFTYVSPVCRKLLGYDPEELIGKSAYEFVHPDDLSRVHESHKTFFEDSTSSTIEYRYRKKDGKYIWLESSGHVKTKEGSTHPASIVASSRDISDRKNMLHEQSFLEQKIVEAQKLESIGVLAAGLAHDFNNWLMTIVGNVDLSLAKLGDDHPVATNLLRIRETTKKLANLTSQLMIFSGKAEIHPHTLDIHSVIDDMKELIKLTISENITIEYNIKKELPKIQADQTHLQMIIMSLLSNANEAMSGMDGTIKVEAGIRSLGEEDLTSLHITSNCKPGDYLYISINDRGVGISDEILPKIFQPFFTSNFLGRGLGLSAVHGIVKQYKGAIQVETEVGKGSTFSVYLPLITQILETTPDSLNQYEPLTPTSSTSQTSETESPLILIVDDERDLREIVSDILTMNSYRTILAADGEEGVNQFKKYKDEIAIILLDYKMPKMNGDEVLTRIREIDKNVPVILVSGFTEEVAKKNFEVLNLNGYIQKPYLMSVLLDAISDILNP